MDWFLYDRDLRYERSDAIRYSEDVLNVFYRLNLRPVSKEHVITDIYT